MSNHARRHRPYSPPTRGPVITMSRDLTVDEHLRQHLTSAGCTCSPEVTITTDSAGIHHANVAHDPWCPLLTRAHADTN